MPGIPKPKYNVGDMIQIKDDLTGVYDVTSVMRNWVGRIDIITRVSSYQPGGYPTYSYRLKEYDGYHWAEEAFVPLTILIRCHTIHDKLQDTIATFKGLPNTTDIAALALLQQALDVINTTITTLEEGGTDAI